MAKRRPKDPLAGTKPPRWGATQKQGAKYERERADKNRIHQLEQLLRGADIVTGKAITTRDNLMHTLDTVLSPKNIDALKKVCMLPVKTAIELGIEDPLGVLCAWLAELEGGGKAKASAAITAAARDKVEGTNPNAVFPSVSGVVSEVFDGFDADSINDLYVKGADVRLERMDNRTYWLGITPIGGQQLHIDISPRKSGRLHARLRR